MISKIRNIIAWFLSFFGLRKTADIVEVEEIVEPEFYNDIYDCPVKAYHDCIENEDFKYLIKSGEYDKKYNAELETIFNLISDQKIDEFGVNPQFELYYYKLRDYNKLMISKLEGDESASTKIEIIQNELSKLLKKNGETNIRKIHARLDRAIQTHYQGRKTDGMTVFQFYNDVADMVKDQEKMKRDNENRKLKRRHG